MKRKEIFSSTYFISEAIILICIISCPIHGSMNGGTIHGTALSMDGRLPRMAQNRTYGRVVRGARGSKAFGDYIFIMLSSLFHSQ